MFPLYADRRGQLAARRRNIDGLHYHHHRCRLRCRRLRCCRLRCRLRCSRCVVAIVVWSGRLRALRDVLCIDE